MRFLIFIGNLVTNVKKINIYNVEIKNPNQNSVSKDDQLQVSSSVRENEYSLFSNKNDFEIWADFKKGNKAALIYIYNTYFDKLFAYAMQFTKDNELIKDAIQDVFVRLFESRRHLSDTDSIKFYLFRSIRREVVYLLGKKRKSEDHLFMIKGMEFEYDVSFEEVLINRQLNEQTLNRIRTAANNLQNRQREIIFYHFFEGFSIKQIKELMKFNSVQATYNLLNRAINQLRAVLSTSIFICFLQYFQFV